MLLLLLLLALLLCILSKKAAKMCENKRNPSLKSEYVITASHAGSIFLLFISSAITTPQSGAIVNCGFVKQYAFRLLCACVSSMRAVGSSDLTFKAARFNAILWQASWFLFDLIDCSLAPIGQWQNERKTVPATNRLLAFNHCIPSFLPKCN